MRRLLIVLLVLALVFLTPVALLRSERVVLALAHWAVDSFTDLRLAKEAGVMAGMLVVSRVFWHLDPTIKTEVLISDGQLVKPGDTVAVISGSILKILQGERLALNFLSHLSGIASLTTRYRARVGNSPVRICDTRKTTPGWRALEKYAVRTGGAANHRMSLSDGILIKDNHIDGAGSISKAVNRCLKQMKKKKIPIEVETRNLAEVQEALSLPVQRIMLDNMNVSELKKAVLLIAGKVETEASGNITLENVMQVAETGVDFISVGSLTHSVPALDISLEVS